MGKRNDEILSLLESLKSKTSELLANQMLYNEMVDNNTDGLLVVDDDGIIRFANKMAAKMFNCKKAKKLEGEIFGFNPIENETIEIEIATDHKMSTVEMRSNKTEWDGRQAMLVILRAGEGHSKIRSSLQRASENIKALINSSPLAIIALDINGVVTLWSKAAEILFSWSEVEMRGSPFPLESSAFEDIFEQALSGESSFKKEIAGQFGNFGLKKIINLWATPLKSATGRISGVMLMIADVTESKLQKLQMERSLVESEKRFRMALSNSPISVSTQDIELRYTWTYNPMAAMNEMHMIGRTDADLFSQEDAIQLTELKSEVLRSGNENRAELKIQHDGHLYFYDISVEPMMDDAGIITGVTCAATDVSALRHTESLASFALHHDTLTGLPNRTLFRDRLQQALILAQREGNPLLAVLHFGIDQFKTINQGFGHAIGDQLLLDVGNKLVSVMYEIDTVSRVGGDEFLILVHSIQDSQDTASIVKKIIQSFEHPFILKGQEIYLTASIGISVYPNDGVTEDELLKNANVAMHRAKEELGRGNYRFFCADMNSRAMHKLTLETDLHRALKHEEFHLHYQPQVDAYSNAIIGAEVLIRWGHPEKGNIPPVEFIPASENSGLIEPIGDWVLQTACLQHRKWIAEGLPPIRLAVNLSARQFQSGYLVEKVAKALVENAMSPDYLELELTESMLMHDVENTVRTLHELKRLGVRLSIDDFGTGYSSLSYLKRFPLDILKIDQSFVKDLGTPSDNGEIAQAIIAMAHALNLKVVAEGVENQQQLELMRNFQCDYIQGYFYSKPVPAENFAQLLKGKALGLFVVPNQAHAA